MLLRKRLTVGNAVLKVTIEYPVSRRYKFVDSKYGRPWIRLPWEVRGFVYALLRGYVAFFDLGVHYEVTTKRLDFCARQLERSRSFQEYGESMRTPSGAAAGP